MPILSNPKHELFAQERAKGVSASEAYVQAGFKKNDGNAGRLNRNEHIAARVQEILNEAAERCGVTVERIVQELAKIGFSDIRKAVKWKSALIVEEDNPDGGDVLVIKNIVTNTVEVVSSDELDDDTAAAVAEISQNEKGGVKIKLHDKKGALVDLGRHLGMFKEKHEHSGPDGGPIEMKDVTDEDRAKAMLALMAKGQKK